MKFSTENLPALGTLVYYVDDRRIRGKVIGYATVHGDHYLHPSTSGVHTLCLVDIDTTCILLYPEMVGTPVTCFPCTPDLLAEPRWEVGYADGSVETIVTYDLVDWRRDNPSREDFVSVREA